MDHISNCSPEFTELLNQKMGKEYMRMREQIRRQQDQINTLLSIHKETADLVREKTVFHKRENTMNQFYYEKTDTHQCLTVCPYTNGPVRIGSLHCTQFCSHFVAEKPGNVVICSFPGKQEKQEKPIELEVVFEKSRLDINGMTMYEYYKIIPEGNVTRVSSLYKQSFDSVIFLDSKGRIIKNIEIRKSFEKAIEKTADYSECPKCANTCRSQNATLAACPRCGQIFEVKKYSLTRRTKEIQ